MMYLKVGRLEPAQHQLVDQLKMRPRSLTKERRQDTLELEKAKELVESVLTASEGSSSSGSKSPWQEGGGRGLKAFTANIDTISQ